MRWESAMQQGRDCGWIFDGVFKFNRDRMCQECNLFIHLDYSFPTVFARLLRRTFWRVITAERLWGTENYESVGMVLKLWDKRASILAWQASMFQHYRAHGQDLGNEIHDGVVLKFRQPKETAEWLRNLQNAIR